MALCGRRDGRAGMRVRAGAACAKTLHSRVLSGARCGPLPLPAPCRRPAAAARAAWPPTVAQPGQASLGQHASASPAHPARWQPWPTRSAPLPHPHCCCRRRPRHGATTGTSNTAGRPCGGPCGVPARRGRGRRTHSQRWLTCSGCWGCTAHGAAVGWACAAARARPAHVAARHPHPPARVPPPACARTQEEDFDLLADKIAGLTKELEDELCGCSIYIVGMMGSGKSTVSVRARAGPQQRMHCANAPAIHARCRRKPHAPQPPAPATTTPHCCHTASQLTCARTHARARPGGPHAGQHAQVRVL